MTATKSGRSALVLSYSPIATDPRISRQVKWLEQEGYRVTVAALGRPTGQRLFEFIELAPPRLLVRLLAYFLPAFKFRASVFSSIRGLDAVKAGLKQHEFHLALVNDLDFCADDSLWSALGTSGAATLVDLHEFFPDLGGSVSWRLMHDRYSSWLFQRLKERQVDAFSTVSEELAQQYSTLLGTKIHSIPNTPSDAPINRAKKRLPSQQIKFVFHGGGGLARGTFHLILAARHLNSDRVIELMLTGSKVSLLAHKVFAIVLAPARSLRIVPPVPMKQIVERLRTYDAGIVFFPPPHSKSLFYSLPNKFFEAQTAGLPVYVGETWAMAAFVRKFDSGFVVRGWRPRDLANELNAASEQVLNEKSVRAIAAMNAEGYEHTKKKFVTLVNSTVSRLGPDI